jgi:hypothetical protein
MRSSRPVIVELMFQTINGDYNIGTAVYRSAKVRHTCSANPYFEGFEQAKSDRIIVLFFV